VDRKLIILGRMEKLSPLQRDVLYRKFSDSDLLFRYLRDKGLIVSTRLFEQKVSDDIRTLGGCGGGVLIPGQNLYPSFLAELSEPPFPLYFRGNMTSLQGHCTAVVGTRRAVPDELKAAGALALEAALAGICIVSGMARGIDAAAHEGALSVGGYTAAVLAGGVEQPSPRQNRKLYENIIRSRGCIISEYAPGTIPRKSRFPVRNRIISGLSAEVIIISAPLMSGSLITARHALNQGRDVYVHSCSLHDRREGSLLLFEQGSVVIASFRDLLLHWYPDLEVQSLMEVDLLDSGRNDSIGLMRAEMEGKVIRKGDMWRCL